jgi:PKD repeat protein
VTDNNGATNTASITITVTTPPPPPNNAPSAAAAIDSGASGDAPLATQFDGSLSSDPDLGDTITYAWDFGDGVGTSTAESPLYTYSTPGDYTASLVVTDSHGLASVASTISVHVTTAPPVTSVTAALSASPTECSLSDSGGACDIDLDASGSTVVGGTITDYTFVTGLPPDSVDNDANSDFLFGYTVPGVYDATVTVTDSNGNSDTAHETVTIDS